jgi:hypothetical protein
MIGIQLERQMRLCRVLLALGLIAACHQAGTQGQRPSSPAPSRLSLTFVAESATFEPAAREYEQLWAAEGDRIVRAMESVSGLTFLDTAVRVIVYEGVSQSGYRNRSPMRMRASYPAETKRATLIHELGHRLQSGLFRREEEEHGPLFLWLYDVWVELYGREFADAQVEVEKRRRGPYPKAWDEALALTPQERAARWRALLAERMRTRR